MAKITVTELVEGKVRKNETFNLIDNEAAKKHFENLSYIVRDEELMYSNVTLEETFAEFSISEDLVVQVRLELDE